MNEDEELPSALDKRPETRYEWDFPTAWLLGTRFVASLRDMLVSAASEFDPRDWMSPGAPIELDDETLQDDGALWLDFLADTGDSPRLVYQIAYLLQQPSLAVFDRAGTDLKPLAKPLPQGRVLVFGGDTSYPIATRRRLLERVRAPFIWARRDLRDRGLLSERKVHLLGIPGNHDYYNALVGFERQFHDRGSIDKPPVEGRVALPGYTLSQRASYFAAILPHGWQLWGLDCEFRGVDKLQSKYFLDAANHKDFQSKWIVVTSRPTVANHAPYPHADVAQAFADVNLDLAFQKDGVLPDDQVRLDLSGDVHMYERYWGADAPSEFGLIVPRPRYIQREFPLADVWPYPDATRSPTGNERIPHTAGEPRSNYASVVSGLGGAFHHPSQVRGKPDGKRALVPRRAWPGNGESDREIGQRLLRPRKLFQAGAVGIIGMLVAALTYSTRGGSLLDLPFDLRGSSVPLLGFGIVAAIAGTFIVLGLLTVGAVKLSKSLHQQVLDLGPPRNIWGRPTHAFTNWGPVRWCLRWAGVNYRNAWGVLITLPAWLPMAALWGFAIFALWKCGHLGGARQDDYVSTYVTVTLLTLFLGVLGSVKLGKRNGALGWILGALLGILTAALIVWTPYAWARLAASSQWPWIFAFPGYWVIRHLFLGDGFLRSPTTPRRIVAVLVYLAVIALYTLIPACSLHHGLARDGVPLWGLAVSLLGSAFLSCLWLGWYFFLCLQWNAHGNEAGGAARVVCFAEFLRIKLTKDHAEVWVIGVDGPSAPKRTLTKLCSLTGVPEEPPIARLIDHFVVGRRENR